MTDTNQSKEILQAQNKKMYMKLFWSSWAMQASWNYERQMNMGFMYGMSSTIDRLYPNEEDIERKKEAYHRHLEFFNITPQAAGFVMGLAASMEEKYAEDPEAVEPEAISGVKTSLMGPLSGIGDSFFQGTIRILAFGLGISLAQQGSILGPIVAIVISAIPSVLITYYGGKIGYTAGTKFLSDASSDGVMDKVMYISTVVGLIVVGAMVASMIGITTPLAYGEQFQLQVILDSILPQSLSLGFTLFIYWLLKKKVSTGWILAFAIVGGIALNYLGIFA